MKCGLARTDGGSGPKQERKTGLSKETRKETDWMDLDELEVERKLINGGYRGGVGYRTLRFKRMVC
jgi:hypothetical protein